ncbi:MAG TPA: 2Fe-2S iron-sulfur cluster-binding protein [Xanthomonadaceae bacterium]|jgi:ferredoxin-NADP reductase
MWAPFNQPEAWNRLAAAINPVWSLTEPMARVVRIMDEAPGVRSLWLKPNRHFGGFLPGQHALLQLEIGGARHARCFSISNAPRDDGLVRLTIKRKDNGPVSTAAHALAVGAVVRLGKAQGAFAPRDAAGGLLLVCAGSGVTPMMSLLQGLADEGCTRDVVLLQGGRSSEDMIFARELRALAARWPRLRVQTHSSGTDGRLDAQKFAQLVPDWAERETLLCGPDGFMRLVEAMYADAGLGDRVQSESFGRRAAAIDPGASAHAVACDDAKHSFTVMAGQSLLDGAEAAGLAPRFGCRRGICRTCQCVKRSGTVTNLLTGQVSGPGEEWIQLCISTPQSALELAL